MIESPEVEKEVKRLLRADNFADNVCILYCVWALSAYSLFICLEGVGGLVCTCTNNEGAEYVIISLQSTLQGIACVWVELNG
jgi:hypothetical protein